MKYAVTFYVLFLCAVQLQGQQEDAWVYFRAKENVAAALASPELLLTQRALDRKERHGVAIDERDIPLDQTRITQIKNVTEVTVLAQSKWFNCVYVRGTETAIRSLTSFSIVARVDFADNSLDIAQKGQKNTDLGQKRVQNANKWNKFQKLPIFDYGTSAAQIEQLNAEVLHENGYTGSGIVIAVMDSGFPNVDTMDAFAQARAEERLLGGYDFVDQTDDVFAFAGSSHGTLTFSDIGTKLPGSFVGTAPDASYYLFRTEDVSSEMPVEEAHWVAAAERADSLGVDVINTSLGYNRFDNAAYNYELADMNGTTAFISKGANIAFEKGMIPVSSAGNSGGDPSWGIITTPGDAMGSFTVGAIDIAGNYVGFSSRGTTADGRVKPDVVARGGSAAVVRPDNTIGAASGTSFSSPIMAGTVASLWQAFPNKTNVEIVQMIRSSASQFNNPDTQLGYGIPDFGALLASLGNETPTITTAYDLYPNPVTTTLTIAFPDNGYNEIQLFSAEGRFIVQKAAYSRAVLDLGNLSKGIYFVVINSKSNRYTQKIIKN